MTEKYVWPLHIVTTVVSGNETAVDQFSET